MGRGRRASRSLGETTIRLYLVMLRAGRPLGVREVQRIMGFKSPSTAKYHLDKLVKAGLVVEEGLGYRAIGGIERVVEGFTRILGSFVPRLIPYSAFVAGALIAYALASWPEVDPFPLAIGLIASVLMAVEGLRMYRWFKSFSGEGREEE